MNDFIYRLNRLYGQLSGLYLILLIFLVPDLCKCTSKIARISSFSKARNKLQLFNIVVLKITSTSLNLVKFDIITFRNMSILKIKVFNTSKISMHSFNNLQVGSLIIIYFDKLRVNSAYFLTISQLLSHIKLNLLILIV